MKNYAFLQTLIVVLFLPFLPGCKKSEDTTTPQPQNQVFVYTAPTITTQVDVDALLITDINLLSGFFPTAKYKVVIAKNAKVSAPSKQPWTIASKDNILLLDKAIKELVWSKANSKSEPTGWSVVNDVQSNSSVIYYQPTGDIGNIFRVFLYSDGTAAVDRYVRNSASSVDYQELSYYVNN